MFHLIVALITIVFNLTYMDQDDLPIVASRTSGYLESIYHTESHWVEWP